MEIRLLRHYINMKGQDLKPDVYKANDPVLGGLASYLVENGYAERVEAQTVALEVANVDELESAEPETPATPEEPISEAPKRKRN